MIQTALHAVLDTAVHHAEMQGTLHETGRCGQKAGLQETEDDAHLLFGSHIPHIVGGGKVRLDDAEAGVSHAPAHSAQ